MQRRTVEDGAGLGDHLGMRLAEGAHHLGACALGEFQIGRVIDHTAGIRVLEINADVVAVHISDTAKEKPIEGEVVAEGSGKVLEDGKLRAPDVKKGGRVLFGKYADTEVKLDGVEHLILREDDILGVIEK